ncbi:unnamed protein product, partial [Amoebophrya sp. A120]
QGRHLLQTALFGGTCKNTDWNGPGKLSHVQEIECGTGVCPQDCEVGPWYDDLADPCTVSCGGGTKGQKRDVTQEQIGGGAGCPSQTRTVTCASNGCPVDCKVSSWQPEENAVCSEPCNRGGFIDMERSILIGAQNGGKSCSDFQKCTEGRHQFDCLTWRKPCNRDIECPVDCVMSEWTDSGGCLQDCDESSRLQTRWTEVSPNPSGQQCPDKRSRTVVCPLCSNDPDDSYCKNECARSCVMSDWELPDNAECSKTCGEGTVTWQRTITFEGNQNDCGALTQQRSCEESDGGVYDYQLNCPIDCELSQWATGDNACSKTCGTGTIIWQR